MSQASGPRILLRVGQPKVRPAILADPLLPLLLVSVEGALVPFIIQLMIEQGQRLVAEYRRQIYQNSRTLELTGWRRAQPRPTQPQLCKLRSICLSL